MEIFERFSGAMLGMAVGDALGMSTEFMKEKQIPDYFGEKVTEYCTNPLINAFEAGEYTDDTSMAICIAESLLECGGVDLDDIAARFLQWKDDDGRDIGLLTQNALAQMEMYGIDPRDAGRIAWDETGGQAAGNGGLMRTAPISLFYYDDVNEMLNASRDICRITHYDPRCVISCQAQNVLLWALCHGNNKIEAYELLCDTLGDFAEDEGFDEAITDGRELSISAFRLDGNNSGYTYLGLKTAISALMNYSDFETPIIEIVNKGGDADTNACIAGALLGAAYGESGIPQRWKDELLGYSKVWQIAKEFYERTL